MGNDFSVPSGSILGEFFEGGKPMEIDIEVGHVRTREEATERAEIKGYREGMLAERERCAGIAEQSLMEWRGVSERTKLPVFEGMAKAAGSIATAIRKGEA